MACFSTYRYGIMNSELEKRKELERRKKLRLIQVRQQSKEFADKLRDRIKGELVQQKKRYLESENKLKQEKHLQELCHLKELYDRCLQSIGKGHKDAAEQPNLNVEKQNQLTQISARASVRGAKAIKKQLEDDTNLKQKTEAPVKKKKATRNKENLRAFFISSLPKHTGHHGHISVPPPKSVHQNTEPQKTSRVLQEIPSNLRGGVSRVPGVQSHTSAVEPTVPRKESKVVGEEHCRKQKFPEIVLPENKAEDCYVPSPNECHCDCVVCACHESPRPLRLRRCSSESRISSDKELDFGELRKKKVRSRSCSPRSVRTLNYFDCGNVYESNQQSFVRVTHHSRSPREAEVEPEPNSVQEVPIEKLSADELKRRIEERSAKALKKEQLKRDFQQLIENLKKLTQEKSLIKNKTKGKFRVFSSERDILTRNENKQRKLNDAFEKLPHSLTSIKTQNTGVLKLNQISSDDSSPPTLNLALYQTNMPSKSPSQLGIRVVSTDEITISETSIPASSGAGKRSRGKSPKPAHSSNTIYPGSSTSPRVLVNTDSTGDVHISVKVSEVLGSKQKGPKSTKSRSLTPTKSRSPTQSKSRSPTPTKSSSPTAPSSGSSYMDLPINLTPSQQQLVDALLHQANKHALGGELKKYINKLLQMSREGIDALFGSSKAPPATSSSPVGGDIERDLMKLGELAELYAEKVNTLVEMYESMSSPSTRDYNTQCPPVDPIRALPRATPTSSGCPTPTARSTPSPGLRPVGTPPVTAPCPAPDPCRRPVRTPPATAPCPAPDPCRRPVRTPPVTAPCPAPDPCMRATPSPTSSGYGRTSQPRYSPVTPGASPSQWSPTPLKRPPQPMVHHPIPQRTRMVEKQPTRPPPWDPTNPGKGITPCREEERLANRQIGLMEQHARPNLGFSRIPPLPVPCSEFTGPSYPMPPPPGSEQSKIPTRPRVTFPNVQVQLPKPEQYRPPMAAPCLVTINESPEQAYKSSDCSADTDELLFGGFGGRMPPPPPGAATNRDYAQSPVCPDYDPEADMQQRQYLIQQDYCGVPVPPEPCWEDFMEPDTYPENDPANCMEPVPCSEDSPEGMLQPVTFPEDTGCPEEFMDPRQYPGNVPLPIDSSRIGADRPEAFPGDNMACPEDVKLDTTFDTSALHGPVNPERVNCLRQKLSDICNTQYRGIIEMLQKETSQHQLQYGNLLKKATSDPLLDPALASSDARDPSEFDTSLQYAEFSNDPFSNINTLKLLVKSQTEQLNY